MANRSVQFSGKDASPALAMYPYYLKAMSKQQLPNVSLLLKIVLSSTRKVEENPAIHLNVLLICHTKIGLQDTHPKYQLPGLNSAFYPVADKEQWRVCEPGRQRQPEFHIVQTKYSFLCTCSSKGHDETSFFSYMPRNHYFLPEKLSCNHALEKDNLNKKRETMSHE